jgi:hypothetical protein
MKKRLNNVLPSPERVRHRRNSQSVAEYPQIVCCVHAGAAWIGVRGQEILLQYRYPPPRQFNILDLRTCPSKTNFLCGYEILSRVWRQIQILKGSRILSRLHSDYNLVVLKCLHIFEYRWDGTWMNWTVFWTSSWSIVVGRCRAFVRMVQKRIYFRVIPISANEVLGRSIAWVWSTCMARERESRWRDCRFL